MYKKTTGPQFTQYGSIYEIDTNLLNMDTYAVTTVETTIKDLSELHQYNDEVIIKCIDGIAMLCIKEHNSDPIMQQFVMHRTVKLHPNLYFNIIPMTNKTTYEVIHKKHAKKRVAPLSKPYGITHIKTSFHIDEIFSFYYSVKGTGYYFDGEQHEYFELTYVDNGSLNVEVEGKNYEINEYELMIFGPNQFHRQKVTANKPCSYLTIMFNMSIEHYQSLINRKFKIKRELLSTLNKFVDESNIDLPYREDLMISLLKVLIINLLQYDFHLKEQKPTSPINQHFENEMVNEIINYIDSHLYEPLSIAEICHHFSISRSSLQNLFKDNIKIAPKKYINEAKLKKSRILIRENKHNISEISSMLGFNSIHYFSRKFTQRYKVTPSYYAKSIYKDN